MSRASVRFWKLTDVRGPEECWEWRGGLRGKGYGTIWIGRSLLAHRMAYEFFVGPLLPGQIVMHSCDNMKCVNPKHLRAGTSHDNHRDMMAKGRGGYGERHANAKLTRADARQVRELSAEGWSDRKLAARFGVRKGTIFDIKSGRSWKEAM